MNTAVPNNYPLASLYVGDLHPEVTEAMLFEKFGQAGQVLSIRVCRDMITRRSLGYAYVNFQTAADAERAMETMNYDAMKGRPIRIMWSQRDPSLRRSGQGNIFIKNLDKSIDNKSMYDTFSGFGPILSCKVAQDENGQSRGYAFVHFENESSALGAIEKINGMLLNGKKVFVGRFIPRNERERNADGQPRKFTNVFIKNFEDELDDDKLHALFTEFGNITSHCVMKDPSGKSRGFGFVSFDTPESAEKAVEKLHGHQLPSGKALFVGRAMKRLERQQELRRQFEQKRQERQSRFVGVNLYVKNLDESVDDEQLKAEFSKYGQISSAKVMKENGRSKGFGFVCFNQPEDAQKAVTAMNGAVFANKPLFVAMAQRKEDRRVQMAAAMMQRFQPQQQFRGPNAQGMQQAVFPAGIPGMQYMYPPGLPNVGGRPGYFPAAQFGGIGMMRQTRPYAAMGPRGNQFMNQGPGQYRQQGGPRPPRGGMGGMPRAQNMPPQQGGPVNMGQQVPPQARMQGGPMGAARPAMNGVPQQAGPAAAGLRTSAASFVRAPPAQAPMAAARPPANQAAAAPGILDPSALAQAGPADQKQMLGEKLFPIIQKQYPDLAGKVTGMLLEIDNAELLLLLESPPQLNAKVEEAVAVLRKHMKQAPATQPGGAAVGGAEGGDGIKAEPAK